MLLVIDVGNTNIVLGVYQNDTLRASSRLTTTTKITSDEMGMMIYQTLIYDNIDVKKISNAIVASVVPDVVYSLKKGILKYFGIDPMFVGPGMKTGINILMDNPRELGADRLVTCVAAYELYGGPVIVVDYGTATTFDAVDKDGTFVTGVTAPGIRISSDALTNKAALLFDVELKKPKSILVRNTISSIQAGLIFGSIGETLYITSEIKREMNVDNIKIVATGGLARVLGEDLFDIINTELPLLGLKFIFEKNRKK